MCWVDGDLVGDRKVWKDTIRRPDSAPDRIEATRLTKADTLAG